MKQVYLSLMILLSCCFSFGQDQPNNIDVALFHNGSNGSSTGSGALVELALRIKSAGGTYTAPNNTGSDFFVFLMAPKTDFDLTDALTIIQVNSAFYGTASPSIMLPQSAFELGGTDLYFPIVFNFSGTLMNLSTLTANWSYAFTFNFGGASKTAAQLNKLKVVVPSNNDELQAAAGGDESISITRLIYSGGSNQLTGTLFATLPVNFVNFSGYKSGTKNVLSWTTGSESNSQGFEIQRASDGSTYSPIGFLNTKAVGGRSVSELNYTFDDNNPLSGKKSYYRLRQVDLDNKSTFSNIVIINGDKPKTTEITGVFPNPANDLLNVIVNTPQRANVTLAVTDMNGKVVSQKIINIETGSNTVPVEISQLAKGNYLVKVINGQANTESPVSKFVKH